MSGHPNIDKIIKRIEALLNTNGRNEEEARLYAAKAQELLEAYNLDNGWPSRPRQRASQPLERLNPLTSMLLTNNFARKTTSILELPR